MTNLDYIEVDFYFCGVYQGRRKVDRDSICGALASGDFIRALSGVRQMSEELEDLGCSVNMEIENKQEAITK